MKIADKIKQVLSDKGYDFTERGRTLHTACPICNQEDKLSILKDNGATICYRDGNHFKGWFEDWIMQTFGVSYSEAKKMMSAPPRDPTEEEFLAEDEEVAPEIVHAVKWPPDNSFDISFDECKMGQSYLASRGVPLEVARRYNVVYNLLTERVVIPVIQEDVVYGWQGRAVRDVDKNDRMRNNPGFFRDRLVMFYDRMEEGKPVIVCEGPFDAIKFDLVGGNIATMGKVITPKQIALISSMNPPRVYAALDDDAGAEMEKLYQTFGSKMYVVQVPQSAIDRCALLGKKADFGECTFDECVQAIQSAFQMSDKHIF